MVGPSNELKRIKDIPRRTWTEAQAKDVAEKLTKLLKQPNGTMSLRPAQAMALHDLGVYKGLFGPIRVGGGKTLISLLAPYVLDAKKPLLLMPASLVEKTEDDRFHLANHWRIPRIKILSYEKLGRVEGKHELDTHQPDFIEADEAHRLKNRKAGCTKRVERYMRDNPNTYFAAFSGTIMKLSLADMAHLLRWALKDNAPIPYEDGELDEWCDALDDRINPLNRRDPGALLELATTEERLTLDGLSAARRGFCRRMLETPGVVATAGEQVSCSLNIQVLEYKVNEVTEANFKKLRTKWLTPDDWDLTMAVDVWRHSRELSLGFHYIWSPRPPDPWRNRRRDWKSYCRSVLSHSRTIDTEHELVLAIAKGTYKDDVGSKFLTEWVNIEPTFKVHTKAVWHDTAALETCEKWMKEGPGIVWCGHTFFAEELSRRTGAPYYANGGLDSKGNPISKADPTKAIIASVAANATGRNLQFYSRNLITSCPTGADTWEQLLGRTHRDGQEADEVTVDVLLGCFEHFDAWVKAFKGAHFFRDTQGQDQKLLIATTLFPSESEINTRGHQSVRWKKTPKPAGTGKLPWEESGDIDT